MAAQTPTLSASNGAVFLISAGIVAEIVAKACSSPQTTELNADTRAPTLMKWVWIGLIESAVLVAIAAYVDRRHRAPIIAGATMEAVITYLEYSHGKKAGLASTEQGTES